MNRLSVAFFATAFLLVGLLLVALVVRTQEATRLVAPAAASEGAVPAPGPADTAVRM